MNYIDKVLEEFDEEVEMMFGKLDLNNKNTAYFKRLQAFIKQSLLTLQEQQKQEIGEAIRRLIVEAGNDIEIAIKDLLNYSDVLRGVKKY